MARAVMGPQPATVPLYAWSGEYIARIMRMLQRTAGNARKDTQIIQRLPESNFAATLKEAG
jgi:hypothetical protein